MKVLFAVNNESISESIIKKYQQEYKEIISVKNVYYFNAIIKELQRDKSYDRIVISEDLQPFSNNNYDAIDKFIFEKMDTISDEATNESGNDIPIILICTDRRAKSEALLVKLFGIGVYDALIGQDRSITNVCELLYRPRTKKEAKVYYRIDSENVDYKVENEEDVSEVEIQNILNHYKKLGRNEEKYVDSFNHIASQYTDAQLRLIAKFLPLNVKAVLEANSPKYQEVVSFGGARISSARETKSNEYKPTKIEKTKYDPRKQEPELDIIKQNLNKNAIKESIVIPSAINTNNIKKVQEQEKVVEPSIQEIDDIFEEIPDANEIENSLEEINEVINEPETEQIVAPKRRGRPRKIQPEVTNDVPVVKKGRGRPRKVVQEVASENIQEFEPVEEKNEQPEVTTTAPLNLFELDEEPTQNSTVAADDNMFLPGFEDEDFISEETNREEPEIRNVQQNNNFNANNFRTFNDDNVQTNIETKNNYSNVNFNNLLTKDKKIVAFVGTSKNGTSFLVNNVAELLSEKGINTAILDLTQNKNAYYIYTENEESLRKTACTCIDNLKIGNANGIQVHKNLTVYTTLPGEDKGLEEYGNILETLIKNYSLVILDCDFETDYNYFGKAQEIYLVQSLDVLTIQPLTAFLRNLKAKNVLNQEKLRVVLNKVVGLKSVSQKAIIGGMAFYNDPAMSFMTELFNKDTVQYCSIPFEEQTYTKYLDALINCKITLNGYSKNFMQTLNELGDMVYPLINSANTKKDKYSNYNPNANTNFSNSMNDTLNRMKNNY